MRGSQIRTVWSRPTKREQCDWANLISGSSPSAMPPSRSSGTTDSFDVPHCAICEHFAEAGVPMTPLTDLDRTDFSADHEPDPLLDGRRG